MLDPVLLTMRVSPKQNDGNDKVNNYYLGHALALFTSVDVAIETTESFPI